MLTVGIFVGLLLGLLAGGSLANLASIRLRLVWVLLIAVILRFGTETALGAGIGIVDTLRIPLLAASFGLLLAALWANRSYPGMSMAFVGILSNAVVILVNRGYMPIWDRSLELAGFTPTNLESPIHFVIGSDLGADFLLRLGLFGDIIPIPIPFLQNVASVGDIFLTAGLAFFLFAGTVRSAVEAEAETAYAKRVRQRLAALGEPSFVARSLDNAFDSSLMHTETTLNYGLVDAGALERGTPIEPGLAQPGVQTARRRHPYVRLALNPSFAALWTGQLISLFGDRLHQLALALLVFVVTDSAIASGAVFVVATLPNLFFGPLAGTLVDRWEHKEVLIVSDLLRAAVILLIPIASGVSIWLVYPLVFVVASISIFFRPARVAVLPRIVDEEDLLTANSALWVAETSADVIGYPLAALFLAALGAALPLAFWIDAATYVGSAVLLSAIVVTPRLVSSEGARERNFTQELKDGWRFLRGEPTLLANTIQATVGQIAIGGTIALGAVYAKRVLDGSWGLDYEAIFGFLEMGIGVGNLLGGVAIGLLAARLAKGHLIIAGYTLMGVCMLLLGFVGDFGLAFGLMFGVGIANMVFVIPSQTLFQERTPNPLLGRVISFRFALVGGAMTLAMGATGVMAELIPVAAVIGGLGGLTIAAGLAGLFVPAIKDA